MRILGPLRGGYRTLRTRNHWTGKVLSIEVTMSNVAGVLREYARLEGKRGRSGLTVSELERWSQCKATLDGRFSGARLRAGSERRGSVRVPTRLLCNFATETELSKAIITNLSSGGVFISTSCPLSIGTDLRMQVRVESTGFEMEVCGLVVSINVGPAFAPDQRGMGVRFSNVGEEVLEQISDLYAEQLARHARDEVVVGHSNESQTGDDAGEEPA
jgi:uncharacterized protein (TIGR02266 family)